MGCSSCGSKKTKSTSIKHDTYFLGEQGFDEIRYLGWTSPYTVYGERQLYTFTEYDRVKLVDKRDTEILLTTIEDGVKVFDKNEEGNSSKR